METTDRMEYIVQYIVPGFVCGKFLQAVYDAGFSALFIGKREMAVVKIRYEKERADDYLRLKDELNNLLGELGFEY